MSECRVQRAMACQSVELNASMRQSPTNDEVYRQNRDEAYRQNRRDAETSVPSIPNPKLHTLVSVTRGVPVL